MTITLFVPVFNEIDGLKVIMPQIPKGMFDQILVSDGQSTDGSADWARAQGYDVYVQKQKGIRYGYIEAWPLIRSTHVITFSPDGNCIVADLPKLIGKLNDGYDMVIASRYLDGATSEDDSWFTGFGNWLFTTLINVVHGGSYVDALTIYRGYRTALFNELRLGENDSYAPDDWVGTISGIEPLISVRALKTKQRVVEVPSDEPKRIAGESCVRPFLWGSSFLLMIFREKLNR